MNLIQEIDNAILFFVQELHFSLLDKLMVLITKLGDAGFIWFLLAIILLITEKYRKFGFIFGDKTTYFIFKFFYLF